MERIELATPEGPVDAVVAGPDGRGPWPGVVIVHDMVSATSGGLPGIIERVADTGHLVIAPNVYSRGGPIRCVTRVVRELRSLSGRAFDDVHASHDWLVDIAQVFARRSTRRPIADPLKAVRSEGVAATVDVKVGRDPLSPFAASDSG